MRATWFRVRLVAAVAAANAGATEAPLTLRAPAVPLVAHDPYFSIWSAADRLTEVETTHWTGKPHRLHSMARVDGRAWRVLGAEPAETEALPQVSADISPTRTTCRFAGAGVRLDLEFLTPALPSDLDALSRPVTYVRWTVASTDGRPHAVQLYFDAGAELAVDAPRQEVTWDRPSLDGFLALRAGSREQRVLGRSGDDLRIEWGYAWLAAPRGEGVAGTAGPGADVRGRFAAGGTLPEFAPPAARQRVEAGYPVLAAAFDLGAVGAEPVSRHALMAYDDEWSIRYFGSRLRPYWRRAGQGIEEAIRAAERARPALDAACRDFDRRLMEDLRRVGGGRYALLCALAYRQTWAGNKIAADANGLPLVFPKENFSNGCIGTVDVLFPQAPFFLLFSPALTKGMLVPVLDYAASPLWPYPYAPHDLGRYPFATGQVYGMGGGDGGRMPVEESGNMLILLAALARAEGDAEFSRPYRPLLARWADYLVAHGLDPQNQLCSADMFGPLPHGVNLALKAVIGIGGYARLCEQWGREEDARRYRAVARDYAAQWMERAKDDGRTRLAYDLPGTWGMKHNLIWDRVLGLGLFPDSVGDAEIAWYLKAQGTYGLPVDHRTDTSLLDWAMWSIAPARAPADFEALVEPLFRYANETPSRVPLSDWFVTSDARKKGFQARPVVGGIFIRLLADSAGGARWRAEAEPVKGRWAPLPLPAPVREVVSTARKAPVEWRYTLEAPPADWARPDFDDSAWKTGPAGFGRSEGEGVARTPWATSNIWIRRAFTLPETPLRNPRLLAFYDEDPEFFVDGVPAAAPEGWTGGVYAEVELAPAALAALKPGRHVLAVRCRQTWGGQFIDAGLAADADAAAAEPGPPPGLRKLMDVPLRDPMICRAPDGTYYLTGTSEPFWGFNNENGIRVWTSRDLVAWKPLGTVWRYGGSPWHAKYLEAKKPLWAPEIHYLKNTFWLTYSMPGWDGTAKTSGSGLLKSASGKPEGPYEDVQPGERLGDEIDASLFEDDDGTVYFLWHSGKLARMKPDMSGLAEPYRWLRTVEKDPDPKHHSGLCAGIFGKDSFDHVGYEGMFLFKAGGRYHLCVSDTFHGRYSCAVASSANLFGPYPFRYEAIPHGGHSAFFRDGEGRWWSTYFGPPWNERPAILPIEVAADGRVRPAAERE